MQTIVWQMNYSALQPIERMWALDYIITQNVENEELLQDEEYEDIFHTIMECESGATDEVYFNVEERLKDYAFRKGINEQELTPKGVVIAYFYHNAELQGTIEEPETQGFCFRGF